MPIKKLLEESCVRNFRNPLFAKLLLIEILGHFQKLFWAKILGVRNFRVFEIFGHHRRKAKGQDIIQYL